MSRLSAALRRHLPFVFIMPLLIVVMTWPALPEILDGDSVWLHTGGADPWYKFWDAWHIKRVLAGQADYFFSDAIFHPHGVSLAFHQIALPHALVFYGLQSVLPLANAYNLCFLLILFINAWAAYLLLRHLLGEGWVSLFGAMVFCMAPQFLTAPILPDLILTAPMPLAVYCFRRAVMEDRRAFAALAGIAIGVTAFIGLYIYVCLALTLAMYAAVLALPRWRTRSFWRLILALTAVAGAISGLRLYPMIADPGLLHDGLGKYSEFPANSADVADFLVNDSNPWTGPVLRDVFQLNPRKAVSEGYLGYTPLILIFIGLLKSRRRRAMLPWLGLLCVFLMLRLGDYLVVDGKSYRDILLPGFYLGRIFPLLFDAFGLSARFQIGVVLPLAVLSCFGLSSLLSGRRARVRQAAICLCLAVVALEYYVPLQGRSLQADRFAHLEWLRQAEARPVKLIHLPMRRNLNKYYMFLQTLGAFPQANGATNRTPGGAYGYLNDNFILYSWRGDRNINCSPELSSDFTDALDQLQADGFTHIVFHRHLVGSAYIRPGLLTVEADYADEQVTIYRLGSLRDSCRNPKALGSESLAPLRTLAGTAAVPLKDRISIVSVHPSAPLDYLSYEENAARFSEWHSLIHLFRADEEVIIQSLDRRYVTVDDIITRNDALLLVHDPTIEDSSLLLLAEEEFSEHFRLCERVIEADDSVFDYYAKRPIPCPLLLSASRLRASYDSGLQLRSLHFELRGSGLEVYALWRPNTEVTHAFSIQIFDERGQKALGQDFIIHFDPAMRYRVDLESLAPGTYSAKLIVYDYDTGRSVPGTVPGENSRFARELEFGRLTIN